MTSPHSSSRSMSFKDRFIDRVLAHIHIGYLTVTYPNGTTRHYGKETETLRAHLIFVDENALTQIIRGGTMGFAEAYMNGVVQTDDLSALLTLLAQNLEDLRSRIDRNPILTAMSRLIHVLRPNSRRGARRNIQAHYDLGNEFYAEWLDPSMTYSSARFTRKNQSLEKAQEQKYAAIARIANLEAAHNVLEIGCGWGGFAEYAGHHIGCNLAGITISQEQFAYAQNRLRDSAAGNHASVHFQDYRDVTEKYDRVVSIEMFEAVGQKYWPVYFSKIRDVLKPGGKAALQIITIHDQDFDRYSKGADFIQRYIFPGGMLPSLPKLREQFHMAELREYACEHFGADYARTLALWKKQFLEAWPKLSKMGFDERFKNMWCYYLSYCEAGFNTGSIDVVQIGLERPQ